MDSPFQSALELFIWSKRHFDILEANVSHWAKNTPKTRVSDYDAKTGETLHKYRFVEPFPWEFGAMAFDVANTQRATLDYIMYASAVAINGGQPQGTKFPFGGKTLEDALNDLRRVYAPRRRKGLPHPNHPIIIARALQFKPYEGGERDLWALNQLRNMKHHRLLSPTAIQGQNIVVENFVSIGGGIELTNEWDGSRNELTYIRTPATFSQHDCEITISVAFGDGTIASGRLVTEFFSKTGVLIQNIFKTIERKTIGIRRARGMDDLPLLTKDFP